MELQLKDRVDLYRSQARRSAASGRFSFQGTQLVLAAIELDAFEFPGLAVFGDGDVLLGEIFEQVFLGFGTAGRSANDADDVIEMVERNLVADQNVSELAGLSGNDGQQDHAEGFLHLRVLEKIVENELRFFAALDFDHDAHAFTRGLVAHIGDAFDFFRLHQVGYPLDEPGFVDLIWDLGDDNVFAVLANFFDGRFRAHHETAASGFIGGFDAFAAGDVRAGRKIRAGNQLHHFFERGVGLFDQQNGGVHNFAKVVRRNVGGHADGDAAGAVDEEIGNARRKDEGLFTRLIEVGNEVDGFFFEVGENVFADFRQARFGVPHGRRWVAVDGAEISLAVNQRIAHVEILREADERGVDNRFTVRVIIAGSVAADFRALAVAPIGGQAKVVHGHQDAPLHRLQAV